jgi:hypothetical protein
MSVGPSTSGFGFVLCKAPNSGVRRGQQRALRRDGQRAQVTAMSSPPFVGVSTRPTAPRSPSQCSLRLRVDGFERRERSSIRTPYTLFILPAASLQLALRVLHPFPPHHWSLEPGSVADVGVPRLRFVCDGKQVVQLKDQGAVGCRVPVGDETTELRSEDTPLVGSEHRIQGSDFGVVLPEICTEPVH